jgi:hypothetical protein
MGIFAGTARRPLGVVAPRAGCCDWCGGGWQVGLLFNLDRTAATDELH